MPVCVPVRVHLKLGKALNLDVAASTKEGDISRSQSRSKLSDLVAVHKERIHVVTLSHDLDTVPTLTHRKSWCERLGRFVHADRVVTKVSLRILIRDSVVKCELFCACGVHTSLESRGRSVHTDRLTAQSQIQTLGSS